MPDILFPLIFNSVPVKNIAKVNAVKMEKRQEAKGREMRVRMPEEKLRVWCILFCLSDLILLEAFAIPVFPRARLVESAGP